MSKSIPIKALKRDSSLFLSFNKFYVDKVRKVFPILHYDSHVKHWYTFATPATFIALYQCYPAALKTDDTETKAWVARMSKLIPRLAQLQKGAVEEIKLPDLDYVLTPFKHQREAIAFALNLDKCALWLDMGLGKTFTSITVAKLRHRYPNLGGISRVLVIAPRSLLYQWEQEIHRFDKDAEVVVLAGTKDRKTRNMNKVYDMKYGYTLVTYESLSSYMQPLADADFDMFILDEATKMKNPKAQRTVATAALCGTIPYGISLTGMAYVNNPLDLFSQFLAIDPTIYGANQWEFSEHYIDYGKAPFGRFIRGFKHLDELKEKAYIAAFSRTKSQCLDLPAKVYQTRSVPLYEAQYEWYDNLLEQIKNASQEDAESSLEACSEIPDVTVEYIIALTEKLQQITSGFLKSDTGEIIWLDSPKYAEMWDVIKNSTDNFIVWARHTFVLNKIATYLAGKGVNVEVLSRKSSDASRRSIKERFKRGKIRVLVLQLQSECRGNDFTCETTPVSSIFFENTASVEERSQAEDRQHRIGMTGTAVYVDLVCEDTYDEGIKLLLENKRQLAEYIRTRDLEILLGKGGSVTKKTTKSTKKPKTPSQVAAELEKQEAEDAGLIDFMEGMETFGD